jgi:hypothetical protein
MGMMTFLIMTDLLPPLRHRHNASVLSQVQNPRLFQEQDSHKRLCFWGGSAALSN